MCSVHDESAAGHDRAVTVDRLDQYRQPLLLGDGSLHGRASPIIAEQSDAASVAS